jgi:hypothetical protein
MGVGRVAESIVKPNDNRENESGFQEQRKEWYFWFADPLHTDGRNQERC